MLANNIKNQKKSVDENLEQDQDMEKTKIKRKWKRRLPVDINGGTIREWRNTNMEDERK